MLFLIFIHFFLKYLPINSLNCITHHTTHLKPCTFPLKINEQIPDDTTLLKTLNDCQIEKADISTVFSDGSCYAEVSIDYHTKAMIVTLVGVNSLNSLLNPYDDMFGFANGIRSVIQYKIKGNLEQDKVEMITRIQCKTKDNCALDKLRNLLPKLITIDARLNIFKQIISLLNTPEKDPGLNLSCMNIHDQDIECSHTENQCKFDRTKNTAIVKDCIARDNNLKYDIEHRFNVIEEQDTHATDNSAKAFKFSYVCKSNLCNSDNNVQRVDELLYYFAVSPSDLNTQPASQAIVVQNSNTKKSEGVSLRISFYSGLIVIFGLII